MAKLILTGKYIPIVGEGKARWNNVHVADLADVYRLLIEAAVAGKKDDSEMWGPKAYYLTENGEHLWSDIAAEMGKTAESKGFVGGEALERRSLSREEALDQAGFEAESWGMNSRAKSIRPKKVLGWQPTRPSLEDSISLIVEQEYARL